MKRSPGMLRALSCAAVLAGCAEAPDDRTVVVRDSAGIELIDHGRVERHAVPEWAVSPRPHVRIGTVSGDESLQFHRIQDAVRTADGAVAVIDQSRTLRLFDSDGRLRWTAGGEGDGPGEFRFPSAVREIAGDSLVVWDGAANRLSIFSADGRFVRDATLKGAAGYTMAWGLSGPRHLLIEARRAERTRIDGHEALLHPSDFFRVDLEGNVTTELGRQLFATNFQEVDENGAFSPAIFATHAVIGGSAEGFWYGDTEAYELRELTGPESIRRIVRWQGLDRTVGESDFRGVLATWSADVDDPALARWMVEYGNTHPRAELFPAYEELRVDREDRLWVREYVKPHADDGVRRWLIFSADGSRILGRLDHAASIRPLQFGDDWMLAVQRDDLDVEWIALYGVTPAR